MAIVFRVQMFGSVPISILGMVEERKFINLLFPQEFFPANSSKDVSMMLNMTPKSVILKAKQGLLSFAKLHSKFLLSLFIVASVLVGTATKADAAYTEQLFNAPFSKGFYTVVNGNAPYDVQPEGTNNHVEVDIPMYMYFDPFPVNTYLTGSFQWDYNFSSSFRISSTSGSGGTIINQNFIHFEPVQTEALRVSFSTNTMRFILNNLYNTGNAFLIGYFHIELNHSNNLQASIFYSGQQTFPAVSNSNFVYASSQPKSLYDAFRFALDYGLDHNVSIDTIIDQLDLIRQYTWYDSQNYEVLLDLYDLLDDYINGNQSSDASQAAADLESQNAAQASQEAALINNSGGSISGLQAVNPLGALDTVSSSIQFMSTGVDGVVTALGPFWIIIVFGLVIGLIGFILRLR